MWKRNGEKISGCQGKRFKFFAQNYIPIFLRMITRFRNAVPVDKKIVVTFYYLSEEGRMRKVANTFGIGKSTVSVIIRRVTKAISVHLAPKYIQIPSTEKEVEEMVGQFYEWHGFPMSRCCRWNTYCNKETFCNLL